MKKGNRILSVVMAIALLLCGIGALAEGTVTVNGVGVVQVDADQVTISLGVREIAADVASAQASVNEKIGAVIAAMKELGVNAGDISTNGLGVYPNYTYDEVETINGYTAYNTIVLTLKDVNNSGVYIDAAFAAGANSLDYVEFSAADTAEAADAALTLAVQNAQEKARVLAEAAGVVLGPIVEIRESGDNGYGIVGPLAKNAETDAGAGTEVLASKQLVTAMVGVTFAIQE